jgi:poly(hydroxyalkanoate) depolymerase family esterase
MEDTRMKYELPEGMREAMRLTRSGRLAEATSALRHLLGGRSMRGAEAGTEPGGPPTIDGVAEPGDTEAETAATPFAFREANDVAPAGTERGQFLARHFRNHAGERPYKLFIPAGYRPDRPVPLLVMLHGCAQTPDDFAAGTRMNEVAGARGCLVAYPAQIRAANSGRCWNWFLEKDQRRDAGEPALIAGITREIMRDHAIDPRRVYVAGLSAGGAAAAILGQAYPDLYAAIGVHSGLACGAARDLPSALAAMKNGGGGGIAVAGAIPAIVFHGDRDTTVHPRNGDAVAARASAHRFEAEPGRAPGGHAWRRARYLDAAGRVVVEHWLIHGAGHAWSGGSPAGSFTDPRGPDASGEMLRFFLEHSLPMAGAAGS